MKFNKNAVGREIPEYLEGIGELVPFKGVDAIKPTKSKAGAKLRMRIQDEKKLVASIEEAIKKIRIKRWNDYIFPPPYEKWRYSCK